jgi:hypothetical protein
VLCVLRVLCRVCAAKVTSTALDGLPVHMSYTLIEKKDTQVVEASFMPDRFTPLVGGRHQDALLVATPNRLDVVKSTVGADHEE